MKKKFAMKNIVILTESKEALTVLQIVIESKTLKVA